MRRPLCGAPARALDGRRIRRRAGRLPGAGGFTLLELLLVVVIFSLSIALVSPYIGAGLSGVSVKVTSRKIAAALNEARALALRDRRNYYVRVAGRLVVVEPAKGPGKKKELPVPDEVEIEARDGAAVVFYPEGGSSGGVFSVKGKRSGYVIQVEPSTGSVKVYPSHEKDPGTNGRTQA